MISFVLRIVSNPSLMSYFLRCKVMVDPFLKSFSDLVDRDGIEV